MTHDYQARMLATANGLVDATDRLRERAEKAERERNEARQQLLDYHDWIMNGGPEMVVRDLGLDVAQELADARAEVERLRAGAWARVEETNPPPHKTLTFRVQWQGQVCYGMHDPFAVSHNADGVMRGYGDQVHVPFSAALEWLDDDDSPAASPGDDGSPGPE